MRDKIHNQVNPLSAKHICDEICFFWTCASVNIRPLPWCMGLRAPRCHYRGLGPIKGDISHQKYIHVCHLKGEGEWGRYRDRLFVSGCFSAFSTNLVICGHSRIKDDVFSDRYSATGIPRHSHKRFPSSSQQLFRSLQLDFFRFLPLILQTSILQYRQRIGWF